MEKKNNSVKRNLRMVVAVIVSVGAIGSVEHLRAAAATLLASGPVTTQRSATQKAASQPALARTEIFFDETKANKLVLRYGVKRFVLTAVRAMSRAESQFGPRIAEAGISGLTEGNGRVATYPGDFSVADSKITLKIDPGEVRGNMPDEVVFIVSDEGQTLTDSGGIILHRVSQSGGGGQ